MKRLVAVAATVAVSAALVTAATRPETPSESARIVGEARAWVKANATRLPYEYEALAKLSQPYRAAILTALPADHRTELWKRHLDSFLLPPEQLNATQRETARRLGHTLDPRQRALVQLMRDSVVPKAFDPALTLEQRQAIVTPTCIAGKALLGRQLGFAIVGMVGPLDTAYTAIVAREAKARSVKQASIFEFDLLVRVVRSGLGRTGLVKRASVPGCSCHVASFCDCPGGYWCVGGGCEMIPEGCGCFGNYSCNGDSCDKET